MTFEQYLCAEKHLNEGLIRLDLSLLSVDGCLFDPAARMPVMERFLTECGTPQRGIPAVHVAGTSGKGSVAAGVAGILAEAGLRTGLHVSPYVQAATEKVWIDGRFLASDAFADLVDWVAPLAASKLDPATPASIHGMASVALAFEAFRRARVEVMVIEVGCGGRYDLTSFIDTSVA
ncbi:MAG: hypothetical protein PHU25_13575, partial [Deltaproteobacteria bacterium]|nr:hypothetical protein [Deltaproteobacteria bacterium]